MKNYMSIRRGVLEVLKNASAPLKTLEVHDLLGVYGAVSKRSELTQLELTWLKKHGVVSCPERGVWKLGPVDEDDEKYVLAQGIKTKPDAAKIFDSLLQMGKEDVEEYALAQGVKIKPNASKIFDSLLHLVKKQGLIGE